MQPRVPINTSIDFMHGYISSEPIPVQFEVIANLLIWFFVEHASDEEASAALASIARTLPVARAAHFAGMPTYGPMQ